MKLLNYFQHLKQGSTILTLFHILNYVGLTFIPLFLKQQGVELFQIMLIWAIGPLVTILLIPLMKTFSVKFQLKLGMFYFFLTGLSVIIYNEYSYILYGILMGLTMASFWISINHIFFVDSKNNKHAKDSSIYFLLGPIIGIIVPQIGSLIIHEISFEFAFLLSSIGFLCLIQYVNKNIKEEAHEISFRKKLKKFKGLKLVNMIEGALGFFPHGVITTYVLIFINTEIEFGSFKSYIALIGLLVSLILSAKSDKSSNRIKYIFPLQILLGLITVVLGVITQKYVWMLIYGIHIFLDNLALPLRLAIVMDYKNKDLNFWKNREFFLNIGRFIVLGITAILFYHEMYLATFVMFGILTIIYPFIIKQKLKEMGKALPSHF